MALERLQCLLQELDYPGMKEMDKDQLCEIFEGSNRIDFLKWIVGQLGYKDLPQNDEMLRGALINFIHSHGFCSDEEKTKFVDSTYDDQFDVSCELRIFFCILEYMCVKKRVDVMTEEPGVGDKKSSNDDIISFCQDPIGLKLKEKIDAATREAKIKGIPEKSSDSVFRLSDEDKQRVLIPEVEGGENDGFDYNRIEMALTVFAKTINKTVKGNNSEKVEDSVKGELILFNKLVDIYSEICNNVETIQTFMKDDVPQAKPTPSEACADIEELQETASAILKICKDT